jgi:hypothetical protein
MMNYFLCHTSKEPMADDAVTMNRHHDKIGIKICTMVQYRLCRISFISGMTIDTEPLGFEPFFYHVDIALTKFDGLVS